MGDMKRSGDIIGGWLVSNSERVEREMPEGMTREDLKRMAIKLMATDGLDKCDPGSIYLCILQAAHLGLSVDLGGEVYIYPRGNRAHFHIGYQGLIKLAKASGAVKDVEVDVVREGDHIRYMRTSDGTLFEHDPVPFNNGPIVGAYALFRMSDGRTRYEVMNKEEIEMVKSKASRSMMWSDFYSEGAKKAVIRRGVKTLSLLPDHQRAIVESDEGEYDLTQKSTPRQVSRANAMFAPRPEPQQIAEDEDLASLAEREHVDVEIDV